jgi:hypothetical protein
MREGRQGQRAARARGVLSRWLSADPQKVREQDGYAELGKPRLFAAPALHALVPLARVKRLSWGSSWRGRRRCRGSGRRCRSSWRNSGGCSGTRCRSSRRRRGDGPGAYGRLGEVVYDLLHVISRVEVPAGALALQQPLAHPERLLAFVEGVRVLVLQRLVEAGGGRYDGLKRRSTGGANVLVADDALPKARDPSLSSCFPNSFSTHSGE